MNREWIPPWWKQMQLLEEWGKHKITVKRMSFKIPMQNKILSLEEIENTWKKLINDDAILFDDYIALFATARAYHELKNEPATRHSTTMQNIGMLRQWLNEERVDKKKMVSNKDICRWLDIPLPEDYRTDEEVITEALNASQLLKVDSLPEDKPHAHTIKAILEAMEGGRCEKDHKVFERLNNIYVSLTLPRIHP